MDSLLSQVQDVATLFGDNALPTLGNDALPIMGNDHLSVLGNSHPPLYSNDPLPLLYNNPPLLPNNNPPFLPNNTHSPFLPDNTHSPAPPRSYRGEYGLFVCQPFAMVQNATEQHMALVCSAPDSPTLYPSPQTQTTYAYINTRAGPSPGSSLVYWINRDFKAMNRSFHVPLGWHGMTTFMDYFRCELGIDDPFQFLITPESCQEQGEDAERTDIGDYLSWVFGNAMEKGATFYIAGDRFALDHPSPDDGVPAKRRADFMMRNIRLNQGNGAHPHHQENSVFEDGGVLIHFPDDGHWGAVFLAFGLQAIGTNAVDTFSSFRHGVPTQLLWNRSKCLPLPHPPPSWAINHRRFDKAPFIIITAVFQSGEIWLHSLVDDPCSVLGWFIEFWNPAVPNNKIVRRILCDAVIPGLSKRAIYPVLVPSLPLPAVDRTVDITLFDFNGAEQDWVRCEGGKFIGKERC